MISANIFSHNSSISFMFAVYHVVSLNLNRVQFYRILDLVEDRITSYEELIYGLCKQAENHESKGISVYFICFTRPDLYSYYHRGLPQRSRARTFMF
jgi:hypothetical protein